MPDADLLADRLRLRRQLTTWRALALVAAIGAVLALGWRIGGPARASFQHHIARISLDGLITGDRATLKLVEDVRRSKTADAVIVSIQSPGGTTTGSEALYDGLRRLSAQKPTVAVVRGLAASGAYIAALGTDHIVAERNSLVGSIGVLFQFPNVSKLLDTVGVKVETIKSAPLKAAPSGLEPTSPEAQAAIAALVSDSYDWFKGLVKERRGLDDAELAKVADGRVFTGNQALPLKLVDEIGEERAGIAWLEDSRGVARDLPVRDWKPASASRGFGLLGMSAHVANFFGLAELAELIRKSGSGQDEARLDGLLALWQFRS